MNAIKVDCILLPFTFSKIDMEIHQPVFVNATGSIYGTACDITILEFKYQESAWTNAIFAKRSFLYIDRNSDSLYANFPNIL